MLILARNVNEIIDIGDDIHIMVTKIEGGTVKLGIQAPRHIPVHRREITEKISGRQKLEKARASKRGPLRQRKEPTFRGELPSDSI